jgi:hypothetical protein
MTWIKEAKVDKKQVDKMILFLENLDGYGIVFSDEDLVKKRINEMGLEWIFGK